MKIIYVENVRIPSERAHAYQIVQTCAWFARQGHDVVLVNPDRAGNADVFSFFGIEPDLFTHIRLPVTDVLAWNWFPFKKLAYAWQRASFAKRLKTWAASQEADVWYTRDPAMIDVLRDASRKFVLELHDRPDAQPSRWQRVRPFVSRFVVITHGLEEELLRLGVDKKEICVAPDGYDPELFVHPGDRQAERARLGLPSDAFVAMYTGSFFPWKGVDLVVRAWANAPADAHLVLIGGPEDERMQLEKQIPMSAKDRVHLYPSVERRMAIRSFAAADIGLLTSSATEKIGSTYTSPLKQFEYLAAGLPILASNVPSSREILTSAVARFYEPSERGFIDTLTEMKNDSAWRTAASDDARLAAAPYTWQQRAQRILDHLSGV